MKLDIRDLNILHFLLLHYVNYHLTDKEFITILAIQDIFYNGEKLLTNEDIAPYLKLTKEEIDEILLSLTKKGILSYEQNEEGKFISSLKNLYQKVRQDYIKDFSLKLNKKEEVDQDEINNIYSYLSKEIGRSLSPKEADAIANWLKQGYTNQDIKDAANYLKSKSSSLSFKAIDKYLYSKERKMTSNKINELEEIEIKNILKKKWLPHEDNE